jgi:hypothetical protein
MRQLSSLISILWLMLLCSSFALGHERPTIITFDAPGAGTGPGQGTLAFVVSSAGVTIGEYTDAKNVYHGFVRSPNGSIITFDVAGAGTVPGQGTQPFSMNARGEITGYYVDDTGLSHGFLRDYDGTVVTFDAPGAGNGGCSPPIICPNGTAGASINSEGTIAGQYVDNNGVFHGFVRSPGGSIHTFDVPGAGVGSGQGTFITFDDGINAEGAIAGGYSDAGGVFHAFVRNPDGSFVTFDPPGSIFTNNSGITPNGTVTSYYFDASSALHGYVRHPDGTFTLFDVSGAGTGPMQGTEPLNINAQRDITGAYIDANGVNRGFLRYRSGSITKFDVAGAGRGSGQGTIPIYNNRADAICGYYVDASGANHGFLRTAVTHSR